MADKTKNKDDLSFEEALEELEALVESMESGETPLAELVTKFESGNGLLKICQQRLNDAELKIEKLKQVQGELKLESFEVEE